MTRKAFSFFAFKEFPNKKVVAQDLGEEGSAEDRLCGSTGSGTENGTTRFDFPIRVGPSLCQEGVREVIISSSPQCVFLSSVANGPMAL